MTAWCPCGDFRRLNAKTIPDRYPILHIHDFAMSLQSMRIFLKLDLVKAYYQVPVAEEIIHKTSLFRLYEFVRVPFELHNAAQTFQRLIDKVFRGLPFTYAYIDDDLITNKNQEGHKLHLEQAFHRLSYFGLKISVHKCVFGEPKINFLGHEIDNESISLLPDKLEAITNFPQPTSLRQLRRFTGLINYYR